MRALRGVYRIVHYPAGDDEDLVSLWLWSDRQGVFSHQTVLSRHQLSDVLPANIHVTVPAAWRKRRLRVSDGVVLHYADLTKDERQWFGSVPITTPRRTLMDAAQAHLTPDLLQQAVDDAVRRKLVRRREIGTVMKTLRRYERETR